MITQADLFDSKSAVLSDCGRYRYVLRRSWGGGDKACFIGLNPSTADAEVDDPTIRRCVGFAKRWGYGGIVVVNLFAWRATDPRSLAATSDPVGPDNDQHIATSVRAASRVVAAWGAHPAVGERGADLVARVLRRVPLSSLGTTRDGSPRHPLYVRADAELRPWPPFAVGASEEVRRG